VSARIASGLLLAGGIALALVGGYGAFLGGGTPGAASVAGIGVALAAVGALAWSGADEDSSPPPDMCGDLHDVFPEEER
jgi:hypothetical protein